MGGTCHTLHRCRCPDELKTELFFVPNGIFLRMNFGKLKQNDPEEETKAVFPVFATSVQW